MGRLCVAWSYLEIASENTIWGILDADDRLGPIITWRLDLRARWQLILDHAHKKHTVDERKELRDINKNLITVTRDRNIIIHGAVHARALTESMPEYGNFIVPQTIIRQACWTIFRGADAGKSFPISAEAVITVRDNINILAKKVIAFNQRHGYIRGTIPSEDVESGWPVRLK